MSQWEKLLERLYGNSGEMRFQELKKILEHYGYRMDVPRGGGSHRTFRKEGMKSITIPESGRIIAPYIRMVQKAVEGQDNERY